MIDEKAHWRADQVETGTAAKRALAEFKTHVQEKPVSFWSNAEDLYGRFSVALMKAITAHPREGWVRASSVGATPEVTAEVVRLSAENASLRKQLSDAEDAAEKDQRDEMTRTVDSLFATMRTPAYRYEPRGEWQKDSEVSLFSVFDWLGPDMIIEATVSDMASTLAMNVRTDRDQSWDIVAVNQVRAILADLMTLELVQPSTRKHPVSDKEDYWSLSAFGRDILKLMLKATLSEKIAVEDEPEGDGSELVDDEGTKKGSDATSDVYES